ncbi:MAG TPA: hypothetical protein VI796_02795 [Candidatus Thermoplasmatota archaeon]|nr:hypothetical protein [Candidatus Thermoplasmatota archaeon]
MPRKTYPLLRWFGLAAAAVFAYGVVGFFSFRKGETNPLLLTLAIAAVIPFVALAFGRSAGPTRHESSLDLSRSTRQELEGAMKGLEKAHKAGDIPDGRYEKAKARLQEAMAHRRD